jgi:hypothetical protein
VWCWTGWWTGGWPERPAATGRGSTGGASTPATPARGRRRLQIPRLPQTLLLPVRQHGAHPDEPADDMAAMVEPARALLDANPDLALHHAADHGYRLRPRSP